MFENENDSFWKDFFRFIVVAAIIILPVRAWVAQPFIVRGASMEPTFKNGQYLIIDELSYHLREPERGDVIVFRFPEDPSKFFIKRVIGLPGESIEIKDNKIFLINGPDAEELKEPYLTDILTTPNGKIQLKDTEYFVLGDNRLFSSDSRRWGALDQDLIIGRAWLRLWPPANVKFLPGEYEFQS
uniref:Signal peptidase I n=1 Tax=Candidatus Giovannonibacteria bacterium GW2011_GWF2_42_19 TaxID=1618659 RepID=A0A0G1BRC6_9BACT|nr:MAG: Signal peptidase I [Candidatus Giovannonibacteria bacterium GW2011_GWF2_42_19]